MTQGIEFPVNRHVGNGVATVFAFTFTAEQADVDVRVDGVLVTPDAVSTNYPSAGGTVTLSTVVPASGAVVEISRDTPLDQVQAYQTGGPFPADSHEAALDRAVRMIQDMDARFGSSSRVDTEQAYVYAGSTGLAGATYTSTIVPVTENFVDSLSNRFTVDTTAGTVTVQDAGIYAITIATEATLTPSGSPLRARLTINGAQQLEIKIHNVSTTTNEIEAAANGAVLSLNAGDVLGLILFSDGTVTTSTINYFTMALHRVDAVYAAAVQAVQATQAVGSMAFTGSQSINGLDTTPVILGAGNWATDVADGVSVFPGSNQIVIDEPGTYTVTASVNGSSDAATVIALVGTYVDGTLLARGYFEGDGTNVWGSFPSSRTVALSAGQIIDVRANTNTGTTNFSLDEAWLSVVRVK